MPDGFTSEATVPEAVERGEEATRGYFDAHFPEGEELRTAAIDLIADVLHAAEAREEDAEAILESAKRHWNAERDHVELALRKMHHPGTVTEIGGVTVKREAMRYVVAGEYAYDVADAVGLVAKHGAER